MLVFNWLTDIERDLTSVDDLHQFRALPFLRGLFGGLARGLLVREASPQVLEQAQGLLKAVEIGWGSNDPSFRQGFVHRMFGDVEDFAPVTLIAGGTLMLAVNPQLPVRSVAELLALAKTKPGELNYGVGARATEVVMQQIKRATGINLVGVPYKTSGADLADAIAGHVQITFNYWPVLEPLVKSGKLRAIAVAAPIRQAAAPDVPTFTEAGVPGVEMFGWVGLFVPAGTPPDIVGRLQKGVAQILHAPALRDEIIRSGGMVGGNSTEEFNAFWRTDRARTGQALAEAGIAPE